MFLLSWSDVLPSGPFEIIASVLSSIAILIFIFTSALKSKKKILAYQSISHVFLVLSEIITKAWSSIIQDCVSITRNVLAYFGKNTKVVNIVLITFAAVFGVYVNIFTVNVFTPWKGICYGGWYGFLPVIANLEYSIVVLNKNLGAKWLKLSFGISSILWAVSFILTSPALLISGLMNLVNGIVAIVSFFLMLRKNDSNVEVED